jgi:hypothetical protein
LLKTAEKAKKCREPAFWPDEKDPVSPKGSRAYQLIASYDGYKPWLEEGC